MSRAPQPPVVAGVAEGRFALRATATRAGEDLVVVVSGGERPHVGCVVLTISHAASSAGMVRSVTSSVLAAPPHREEAIARPIAERLAREMGGTVVVTAGIHDDQLTPDGIAAYLRLGARLADELVTILGG